MKKPRQSNPADVSVKSISLSFVASRDPPTLDRRYELALNTEGDRPTRSWRDCK